MTDKISLVTGLPLERPLPPQSEDSRTVPNAC